MGEHSLATVAAILIAVALLCALLCPHSRRRGG